MGVDENADTSGAPRSSRGLFVGDSGSMSYCNTGRKLKGKGLHHMLCIGDGQLKHPWGKATMHSQSGWTPKEIITVVKAYIVLHQRFMTLDGDGIYRFPTDMPCVVIDNLNACFLDGQKGKDKWIGLRADKEWREVDALMTLMRQFRSSLYMCTASAEHWHIVEHGQAPKYDEASRN
eukprot:10596598-Heterocapsa_arctica.AAC.1